MKVLVFEFITGGGLANQPLPAGLAQEGDLMLNALLSDLSDIAEIQLTAFRDRRLPPPTHNLSHLEWVESHAGIDVWTRLDAAIKSADAVWPIAPETGGILERVCAMVERAGKCLLNSPSTIVRLTSSKRLTLERLDACQIPTVPSASLTAPTARPPYPLPLVVKPDDGAGCEGATVIETMMDWQQFTISPRTDHWLLQPLIDGDPLSLSAVFLGGKARLLTVNRQLIQRCDENFILKGCLVNAITDIQGRFSDLTDRVAAAIPELWGYAGIDLLNTPNELRVLEINPRLTSSYAGIRMATGINPAQCVLNLAKGSGLPRPWTHTGQAINIRWKAD